MTDRLAEIKEQFEQGVGSMETIGWLIAQVEQLRKEARLVFADRESWRKLANLANERADCLQEELDQRDSRHASDLKEALTTHKAECG